MSSLAVKCGQEVAKKVDERKRIEGEKDKKGRACPGLEPGTSCTLSKNHTPRPTSLLVIRKSTHISNR